MIILKSNYIFILIIAALLAASCGRTETKPQEKTRPVKVMEAVEEISPVTLDYVGIVSSSEVRNMSFKSPGRISKILVKKGDSIKVGQALVQLDTKDLEYALKAAEGRLASAQAQYNKAVKGASYEDISIAELNVKKAWDAYDYACKTQDRIRTLYEAGAVSRNDFERAELEFNIRSAELSQSKEAYNQVKRGAREEDKTALFGQLKMAQADVGVQERLLEDAAIKSDIDGYVVDILNKEGEFTGAGMPVVVIRKEDEVVNVGVSQEDMHKIGYGTRANIKVNDTATEGQVTSISQVPDSQTRTYNVEISLNESRFDLGAIANVGIITGVEKGIWIPITSVMSSGGDYVYIVTDDVVERRRITIISIRGSSVMVEGISSGEKLVIEGMEKIKDKDKVSIQ